MPRGVAPWATRPVTHLEFAFTAGGLRCPRLSFVIAGVMNEDRFSPPATLGFKIQQEVRYADRTGNSGPIDFLIGTTKAIEVE